MPHQTRQLVGLRLVGTIVLLAGLYEATTAGPVSAHLVPFGVFQVTVYGLTKDPAGHVSRFRVTNKAGSTANISQTFYNNSNMFVTVVNDTLSPAQAKIYDLALINAIVNGYSGWVVISADQPISATILPSLILTGPATGTLGVAQIFDADVQPISLTMPITYEWAATGQTNLVHMGGLTDTVSYVWSALGPQTVTLTATSAEGYDTKTLDLATRANFYLPLVVR